MNNHGRSSGHKNNNWEMMNMDGENRIPRDKKLLWIAVLAYFPVCYVLARAFKRIEVVIIQLLIMSGGLYDFLEIIHNFIFPVLFYAIIFALLFAFIRYFFRMDDKPYAYFNKRNMLIIAVVSVLYKAFQIPLIYLFSSLARFFSYINLLLFCIAAIVGALAGLIFLAIVLIFIWKLTFNMPQHEYKLFKSAYWNARGAIVFAVSLPLIVISDLLPFLFWKFDYDFYSYNLIGYVNILMGGGALFSRFNAFQDYANMLLCMIPIFYQCKPRIEQDD